MLNVHMDTTHLSDRGNTAPFQTGVLLQAVGALFAALVIVVIWAQVPGLLCDVFS